MKERSDVPIHTPVIREREVRLCLPSSTHIGRMTPGGGAELHAASVGLRGRRSGINTVCDLVRTSAARCKRGILLVRTRGHN